jgi:transcriptional regulator with XRE-family HTH domain
VHEGDESAGRKRGGAEGDESAGRKRGGAAGEPEGPGAWNAEELDEQGRIELHNEWFDEFEDEEAGEFEGWDPAEFEDDEPDVPAVWVVREGRHVGVALRSGRRRLRWNQRELAKRAGLNQATIARLEAGADARFSVVVRALWACGLELVAAPPAGAPQEWRVVPHPADEGRDSGGRRLPAHLPAYPTEHVPTYTLWKRMVRGESLFAERPPHWLYAREPWPVPPEPPPTPGSKAER